MEQAPQLRRNDGFISFKTLFTLTLIGAIVIGFTKIAPAYFEFYKLKDLANRVVGDMRDLPRGEVEKRVALEFGRERYDLPMKEFVIKTISKGYRVTLDYSVPMTLPSIPVTLPALRFYYRTES